jgi:ssDNA-binding Zn-finger/Zn-ribbon topoisomerase 1
MKRITTEEFVAKAIAKHSNKYDYSRVKYLSNKEKIEIICPIHGISWQLPKNHLNGCGCHKCGVQKRSESRKLSQAEFIQRSMSAHGNKYDYSKVDYKGNLTKIEIICSTHGSFWQSPEKHWSGQQCPMCARGYKSWDMYLDIFQKIHGDTYDYSKSKYVNSNVKIEIICPDHGSFWQAPKIHQRSRCPICSHCGAGELLSLYKRDLFIPDAIAIHGEKYDYSRVIYTRSSVKVEIICPKHGSFWQSPSKHLMNRGCPQCGKESISKKLSMGTSEFIEKAKEVHGNFYGYENCKYVNTTTPVSISCPIHGKFTQAPAVHLIGCGCNKCGRERTTQLQRLPLEDFIARANAIHDNFYDYSQSKYNGLSQKIDIVCPRHGVFNQLAGNHLTGRGCPSCGGGPYSPIKPTQIYLIRFQTPIAEFWKLGITRQSIKSRYRHDKQYMKECFTFSCDNGLDAFNIEQSALKHFAYYKLNYLFPLLVNGGDSECFSLSLPHKKLIDYINTEIKALSTTS